MNDPQSLTEYTFNVRGICRATGVVTVYATDLDHAEAQLQQIVEGYEYREHMPDGWTPDLSDVDEIELDD